MNRFSLICIFCFSFVFNLSAQIAYGYEIYPKEWGYPLTTKLVYNETTDDFPSRVLYFNENHIIKYALNKGNISAPSDERFYVRWYVQINKSLICRYNYEFVDIPKEAIFSPEKIEAILKSYSAKNIDYFILSDNGSCVWLRSEDSLSILTISRRDNPNIIFTQYSKIILSPDKIQIIGIENNHNDPIDILSSNFLKKQPTLSSNKNIILLDSLGNQKKYQVYENEKVTHEMIFHNSFDTSGNLVKIATSYDNGPFYNTIIKHY